MDLSMSMKNKSLIIIIVNTLFRPVLLWPTSRQAGYLTSCTGMCNTYFTTSLIVAVHRMWPMRLFFRPMLPAGIPHTKERYGNYVPKRE